MTCMEQIVRLCIPPRSRQGSYCCACQARGSMGFPGFSGLIPITQEECSDYRCVFSPSALCGIRESKFSSSCPRDMYQYINIKLAYILPVQTTIGWLLSPLV